MSAFSSDDPNDLASQALGLLFDGRDATREQIRALFERLVAGELPEPLMAAAFVSLKLKGETSQELTGAVEALRAATGHFERPDGLFADSCGTGGDDLDPLLNGTSQ